MIEVLAVVFGGWSGLEGSGDWGKVPATLPVIIFSLVYHDLAPGKTTKKKKNLRKSTLIWLRFESDICFVILSTVLCAYLGGDLTRLRISVFLGSLFPLVTLLVWDAITFGLSASAEQIFDPVDLLMR